MQLITRCLISSRSLVEIPSRLKLKSFFASPTGERGLSTNTFKFFSYRDPKCSETFAAFKEAIEWSKISITDQHLEEAILGVVSSIDKPLSPVGEAKNAINFILEDMST